MKKTNIDRIRLTPYEKRIENEIEQYVPTSREEFNKIKQMLEARKKNAVLNIRINQGDLSSIKQKAAKMGVKYQTFISEVLHRVAIGQK